jgi:hypothetical protein
MRFFIRTTKDLGDYVVYVRLRNPNGWFWDWIGLSWVDTITSDCKKFMVEYPDTDVKESLYQVSAPVPAGGPWIQEAANDNDGQVYGSDDSVMGELTGSLSASSSWVEKLEFLFQYLAFKRTASTTKETMYDESGITPITQADLSDDGTTFTKTKVV